MSLTSDDLAAIATAVVNRTIGSDAEDPNVTLAEAANRGNYVYRLLVEGGALNAQLDRLELAINQIKADVDDIQARI